MTAPARLQLRIAARSAAAKGIIVLDLVDPEGKPLPSWAPGAHVDVHLPGGPVRAYSLCGDPADAARYRLAVLNQPGGRGGSAAVHALAQLGTELEVGTPRNNFPLLPASEYLFIAGGIGITPILPMLGAATNAGSKWHLAYGGRSLEQMAFRELLTGPQATMVPQDQEGLLQIAELVDGVRDQTLVYACGPQPMLEVVRGAMQAVGRTQQLHTEAFSPASGAGTANGFSLRLARSGLELFVSPEQSILAAVEEAGVVVECLCTDGYCGTCATRVLDGIPDHRDTVLSAHEHARDDQMMICVGRSLSPLLVLDL